MEFNATSSTLGPTLVSVLVSALMASAFVPFRGIKRWSWEVYWLLQALVALVLGPIVLARLMVPQVFQLIHHAFAQDLGAMIRVLLFGALWGVGVFLLGLAVRYLGFALSYALHVGPATLVFAIFFMLTFPGPYFLVSIVLLLASIALMLFAGGAKDRENTLGGDVEAMASHLDFRQTAWLACVSGLSLLFLTYAIGYGRVLKSETASALMAHANKAQWSDLPLYVVILAGAFATNLVCAGFLIVRHRSWGQFTGTPGVNPMRAVAITGNTMPYFDPEDPQYAERLSASTLAGNYGLATLAGLMALAGNPLVLLAAYRLRGAGAFPLLFGVGLVVLFALSWGLVLREWRGTSARTQLMFYAGVALLLAATLMAVPRL